MLLVRAVPPPLRVRKRRAACLLGVQGLRGHVGRVPASCAVQPPEQSQPSRDIAQVVRHSYNVVQKPSLANTSYDSAIKDFVRASVLAYECGCSEDSLRQSLSSTPETMISQSSQDDSSTCATSLEGGAKDWLVGLVIVWLTLMLIPKSTVQRWSVAPPVSEASYSSWKGFVAMIVNAYFTKGMAWFSVKRLQMEQLAVSGAAEPAPIISERMRLVFATLELVSPQFPRR